MGGIDYLGLLRFKFFLDTQFDVQYVGCGNGMAGAGICTSGFETIICRSTPRTGPDTAVLIFQPRAGLQSFTLSAARVAVSPTFPLLSRTLPHRSNRLMPTDNTGGSSRDDASPERRHSARVRRALGDSFVPVALMLLGGSICNPVIQHRCVLL